MEDFGNFPPPSLLREKTYWINHATCFTSQLSNLIFQDLNCNEDWFWPEMIREEVDEEDKECEDEMEEMEVIFLLAYIHPLSPLKFSIMQRSFFTLLCTKNGGILI